MSHIKKLPKVPWKMSSISSSKPINILALRGQEGVNHWSMFRRMPVGIQSSMGHGRLSPYKGVWGTRSTTYRSPQKPNNLGVCSWSWSTTASRTSLSCSKAHADLASGREMCPSLLLSATERIRLTKLDRLACSPTFACWKTNRICVDFMMLYNSN